MIRARLITEHGAEDRKGVQVDIKGELGDLMVEFEHLANGMAGMLEGIHDADERLAAGKELYAELFEAMRKVTRSMFAAKFGITMEQATELEEKLYRDTHPTATALQESEDGKLDPEELARIMQDVAAKDRKREERIQRENASPTCCQAAPESGVTLPDEITEEPDTSAEAAEDALARAIEEGE